MRSFDFLRDVDRALPENLRSLLASPAVRGPLLGCGVVAAAIAMVAAAETYATDAALRAARSDQSRYAAARAAEDAVRRDALHASEAADRLRSLRGSGARVASGLARIANALPARTWLTGIDSIPGGYTLSGEAGDPAAIAGLFAAFAAQSPVLDRVDGAQASRPVQFAVTIEESP